jgi:hypothetical protein
MFTYSMDGRIYEAKSLINRHKAISRRGGTHPRYWFLHILKSVCGLGKLLEAIWLFVCSEHDNHSGAAGASFEQPAIFATFPRALEDLPAKDEPLERDRDAFLLFDVPLDVVHELQHACVLVCV